MVINEYLDRAYDWLTRRAVYHTLFWLTIFTILLISEHENKQPWDFILINEIISLLFYAVLVYYNLLYLIPQYLLKKRLFLYSVLLVAACVVITPIKTLVFFLRFAHHDAYREQLIAHQHLLLLGMLLMGILSTFLSILTGWWRFQQQSQQIATQRMQDELRFLRNQINPHFLFNTLNNLYSLTLRKSEKAPEIVLKLSEIMRYMLYECNDGVVPLHKEIHFIENYLDLERLRQPPSVEISLHVEGQVGGQMVAPLLFIPFVENAFKHGVQNQISSGAYVRIGFKVHDNDLEFFIENSRAPFVPNNYTITRSGGIGLQNARQRLQLLYPGRHTLHIENEPTRFGVSLLLTLQNNLAP